MNSPPFSSGQGSFCREDHKLPDGAVLSALSSLSGFHSSQTPNLLSHWVCISSGLHFGPRRVTDSTRVPSKARKGKSLSEAAFHFPLCELVTTLTVVACSSVV